MTQLTIPGVLDTIPTPGRWYATEAQQDTNQELMQQLGLEFWHRQRWLDIYRWVLHANSWSIPQESHCSMSSTPFAKAAVVLDAMRWIAAAARHQLPDRKTRKESKNTSTNEGTK